MKPLVQTDNLAGVIPGARWTLVVAVLILLAVVSSPAQSQELTFVVDPAQTTVDFTLSATLHIVHGTFRCKRGELRFDPASGKVTGEVVFDATSGQSGNGSRDKKMHKDVLESQKYTEIAFRPDHAVGNIVTAPSTLQVHGVFSIHGADHEITVPVEVTLAAGTWNATAHFKVPYVQWGMKNPSVLFLRVSDSLDVDFHGSGRLAP